MARYIEDANLIQAFFDRCAQHPDKPLLFDKRDGEWKGKNWQEVSDAVQRISAALLSFGIERGDRVLIASENRSEWAISELAIMAVGAISVPAYTTYTEDDHHYVMEHAGAKLAFVSGGQIAHRVTSAARRAPSITDIVVFNPAQDLGDTGTIKTHDFDALLAEFVPLDEMQSYVDAIETDDTACFIYTSGTGGRPKGVMLTHRNIQSNVTAAIELLSEADIYENERFLSLLPLSHSYEHTAGMYLPLQMGAEIWYCEGSDQVANNLAEAKPTLMPAVPRLYEVLHDRITKGVKAKGGLSEKLFNAAVRIGTRRVQGLPISIADRLLDPLLDRLVRSKVKARFGGRLKYFVSGGAALNPEIGYFFMGLGVNFLQGYGLTESSPLISMNRPNKIRIETVGPAAEGIEVKIGENGELLARGDNIMKGYWKDEAATARTIIDGWLHTGDVAVIHDDGYIEITGRIKDIIVNSGGDNIAPSRVEALLTIEPEIEQAMVYGDKRPWLSAVLVPSAEVTSQYSDQKQIKRIVGEAVDRANSRLSQLERVRRFVIADEAFSIENGQMTPTLKAKRHIITEKYNEQLDALYPRKS